MFKILYFLVVTFFFLIIFSFSHIFYIFWSDYVLSFFGRGGYGWIKSSIIVIYWFLFWLWLLIYLLKYKVYKKWNDVLKYVWIIIFWMIISTILSINISGSVIWLSEKYEWLLYYLSFILFFLSVYFWIEKKEYKKITNYIFIFSIWVYIYWFIQFLWLDPLSSLYSTRVDITRASSFFWNANYLAWYILILLPLSKIIENNILKNIFIWISFLALLSTWSYFGIFLWLIYLLYLVYFINKNLFIWLLVISSVSIAYIFSWLSIEKYWSLLARPYIWESSILAIIDTPKTILFWYWPDTLQLVFNHFKVAELSIYETANYTADRTHNIFLDLIYFFWIFWWGIIIYFIINSINLKKGNNIKLSIIFFLLFFSFNVPVSIHFILILFLMSWYYNKNL